MKTVQNTKTSQVKRLTDGQAAQAVGLGEWRYCGKELYKQIEGRGAGSIIAKSPKHKDHKPRRRHGQKPGQISPPRVYTEER